MLDHAGLVSVSFEIRKENTEILFKEFECALSSAFDPCLPVNTV